MPSAVEKESRRSSIPQLILLTIYSRFRLESKPKVSLPWHLQVLSAPPGNVFRPRYTDAFTIGSMEHMYINPGR